MMSVVDQLSSDMEANEKNKKALLGCFKWLAFFLCLSAFLFKTSDSIKSWLDEDIGTKIILTRNYEASLPSFAICKHPNNILYENVLRNEFNSLTGKELKYLKAYSKAEEKGQTLLNVLVKAKNIDTSFIEKVSLIKQGFQSGSPSFENSYSSDPKNDPKDWKMIFHPLFGWCHHFEPAFKRKIALTNKTIVEFMKFHLDYKKAYEDKKEIGHGLFESRFNGQRVHDTQVFDDSRGDDNKTLLIIAYDEGAFFHSQVIQPVGLDETNYFTIEQEIIDKTKTKDLFQCSADRKYVEDVCLQNCLVDRFVKDMGCLHARLFEIANDTIRKQVSTHHIVMESFLKCDFTILKKKIY